MNARRTRRVLVGWLLVLASGLVLADSGLDLGGWLGGRAPWPYVRPAALTAPPRLQSALAQGPAAGDDGTSLVDRPWRHATTGWKVLADRDTPLPDYSFTWDPMVVAGQAFERGLGTYPFSEIIYDLGEGASHFRARVGITDDALRSGGGSVRFLVYGDDLLLYESDVVRAGEPAREVDVGLAGFIVLRLVVEDGGDGSLGDYALWGDPRLWLAAGPPDPAAVQAIAAARQEGAERAAPVREKEDAALRTLAEAVAVAGQRLDPTAAAAAFDPESSALVIGNQRLVALLGYGGRQNGRLTLLRRGDPLPTLAEATPTLIDRSGRARSLADLVPGRPDAVTIIRSPARPEVGAPTAGVSVSARYRLADGDGAVVVSLAMADGDAALDLTITVESLPLQAVRYVDPAAGGLFLGDDIHLLTDRSHLYSDTVRPDGYVRRAPLEATKPALLWSEGGGCVLFALFDYVPSPSWLSVRQDPGLRSAALGLELTASLDAFGPEGMAPPTLSIELVDGVVGAQSFERFRRLVAARYPALPLPTHCEPATVPPAGIDAQPAGAGSDCGPGLTGRLPYQWGSWYAYGPAVAAAGVLQQIELLAANFGDLGVWQCVVDAGWFVQYGREDAELGAVDFQKFPGGVRAVADAAHARGMDLILYLGTGFIHDSPGNEGEWLGLRGLIERHRDWLLPLPPEDGPVHRFLLDYANPDVRTYLAATIQDFFTTHGADGILLDGLADAEGQLIPRPERDSPQGPPHPLLPTLDIYRLVREAADRYRPNAFVESGWLNPTAADGLAHVFRYGDEIDEVNSPYPFGGFLQKLDYAIFSRMALGQRGYLGTATGDPGRPESRWWVQAAAALGSDATLSFDLDAMSPEAVAGFRADLLALDPFQGTTTFGPGLFPDTFATARRGVVYLGIVNREPRPRSIPVALAPLGLDGSAPFTAFDPASGGARRVTGDFDLDLGPQSFRLLVLRPDAGVLWTDSLVTMEAAGGSGRFGATLRGPADVPGYLYLASPPPRALRLDGVPLRLAAGPSPDEAYAYDGATGLLSIAYGQTGARRLEVEW